MHPQTVFTKTSKGVLEVRNKTIKLPRELNVVFLAIDGKSTFSDLVSKSGIPANKLEEGVNKLIADGYIRVFSSPVRTKDSPTQPRMMVAAIAATATTASCYRGLGRPGCLTGTWRPSHIWRHHSRTVAAGGV